MLEPKSIDRHMIRSKVRRDHPIRHVLNTPTLDPPRRPLTPRIRVQKQRNHHRRLVRRPAPPIRPITTVKGRQVHLRHRVEHVPRQVVLRQPLPQRRRHQESLIQIHSNEVLSHPKMVIARPDRPPVYETASQQSERAPDPVLYVPPLDDSQQRRLGLGRRPLTRGEVEALALPHLRHGRVTAAVRRRHYGAVLRHGAGVR